MEALQPVELEQAREHYERRAWTQAFEALSTADRAYALCPEDLERLATAAYLVGRDDDYLDALDRAHQSYLHAGEKLHGARCAFWVGLQLLFRGETGRATGWFGRAERLIQTHECVERGYLLLAPATQSLRAGDSDATYSTATAATEIAELFDDSDLLACALHFQGRALLLQGELARGLALLDETMLMVAAGNLSPIVTGLMYCSVIDACQQVFAAGRAREWTFALSRWCEEQGEMVAFTGVCLVHRAEIMRLHGAWSEALAAAQRASERCAQAANRSAAAAAWYEAGEVHRLRGAFAEAEEAYRNASRHGREPQPGLALLRLAQGRIPVALAAIRRVQGAVAEPLERIKVLPAYVEIALAAGEIAAAQAACDELDATAVRLDTEVVTATAAYARGTLELAGHDAYAALGSLRQALTVWQAIDAPYLAAKTRVFIAFACHTLGDEDGASLELDGARAVFERLGAALDLAQLETLRQRARASRSTSHGLTPRELEVLQLLATGQTNKQIATELSLSEKTVDRHVSNILAKLCVPSRAAATAYAYRHQLL
jgi:DNA-binding CsgD family transcriptional regulator